jgi:hypothetical protein
MPSKKGKVPQVPSANDPPEGVCMFVRFLLVQVSFLMKKLKIKEKKVKKVNVSKWKIEHAKVLADVEPMLATIKTFDFNRLYWLVQHMTQQKRKCLDLDSTAQVSL